VQLLEGEDSILSK